MRRRYHALGLFAGVLVSAAFVWYVAHSLHGRDLSAYATPRAFAGIGAAAIFYSLSMSLSGLAWRGLLRGLGVVKTWRELTAIIATTQIAKYLPGNVGQYVGRAAMSLSRGIGTRAFATTVVIEVLLSMAAAISIGLAMGLLSSVGLVLIPADKGHAIAIILILLVAIIASLYLFRAFAPRLLRRIAPQHAHVLDDGILPPRTMVLHAFISYCGMYFVVGIGFVILAHLLLPGSAHDNPLLIASFALAWVVGFVTPGAPAGLGVREGLLLLLLSSVYSPALAGILIIALRLATTLGDALSFVAGLILLPRREQKIITDAF